MCKERITVIRTGRMESALAVGNRTEPKTAHSLGSVCALRQRFRKPWVKLT
jgi:hypothetical protein